MFKARTAQNVVISVGLQWFNRIIAILSKVVLARLLFPTDFGIFALATGLIGFLNTFGNLGLDYAIIQKGDAATDEDYDVGMSLRLLIAVGLFVASVAIAGPWADLFHSTLVAPTSQILALGYLALPWSFVPATRLTQDLRYRTIAIPNLIGQTANAVIGIGLAFAGFGVWALIYALLLSQILTTAMFSAVRSWRFRFSLKAGTARPLLSFSSYIIVASILGFLITNIDNFTVAFFWGAGPLGVYSLAYGFGTIPSQLMSGPAGAALFPSLTKIKGDREMLRQGYLESFGLVMGVIAPTAIGLAVVAPEVVSILLGPVWLGAQIPLIVLAFYGLARAPIDFSSSIFAAVGRPRVIAELNLYILLLSLPPLFILTYLYNIAGAAVAMTVPVGIVCLVTVYRSAQVVDARPHAFLRAAAGPLIAAEAMGVLVYAVRLVLYVVLPTRIVLPWLGTNISEVTIVLVIVVGVGAAVYFSLLRFVDRHLYHNLVRNALLVVGRRQKDAL